MIAIAIASLLIAWATEPLDRAFYDAIVAARSATVTWPSDLVAIPIDDAAEQQVGARWPWPRATVATLLSRLEIAGADTILVDVAFVAPTDEADEAALAPRLGRATIPVDHSSDRTTTTDDDLAPFLLSIHPDGLPLFHSWELALPRPAFRSAAAGVGHTVLLDRGNVVHAHAPLLPVGDGSRSLPSIALLAVCHHRGVRPSDVRVAGGRLEIPGLPARPMYGGEIPLDFARADRIRRIGAGAFLGATPSGLDLRGTLAVVYVDGSEDRHATPLAGDVAGGEVLADDVLTLEDASPIRLAPRGLSWLAVVAALALLAPWLQRQTGPRLLALTTFAIAAWAAGAAVSFRAFGLALTVMPPVSAIGAVGLLLAGRATARIHAERAKLAGLLQAATVAPAARALAPVIARAAPASAVTSAPTIAPSSPSIAPAQVQTPIRIADRYRIVGPLGAGGMGAIFEAEDESLQRPVAIKVLHASDPQAYRRFRREALAVARINHRNVVQVYEVGSDARGPFIAMELVRGGDLDAALQASGPLDWRRASRIIAAAARGLGAAHAHGVVHRDVKPQNLLLSEAAGDDVKVADFGLAKLGAGGSLTAEGSYLGTIGYLAPEQAMGKEVAPTADVFSLGVTWYRLLSGRHPFHGTASELLKATILQRVPDPRASVSDLPAPIAEVLLAMTAPEPDDRPRDGAEVAAKIDVALATDAAARARSG